MKMPAHPRVGYWVSGEWHRPFLCLGQWIGPQFPDYLIGTKIEQELMEGTLCFHVQVLYDERKPKRERLETVLILDSRDKTLLTEMWSYDSWKKEDTDVAVPRTEDELGQGSPSEGGEDFTPW